MNQLQKLKSFSDVLVSEDRFFLSAPNQRPLPALESLEVWDYQPGYLNVVSKRCCNLRKLRLRCLDGERTAIDLNSITLAHLTHLELNRCTIPSNSSLRFTFPSLTHLELLFVEFGSDATSIALVNTLTQTKLQSLFVHGETVNWTFLIAILNEIQLSYVEIISESGLPEDLLQTRVWCFPDKLFVRCGPADPEDESALSNS